MKEISWVHTAIVLYGVAAIFYLIRLFTEKKWAQNAGWGVILLGFISLAFSLYLRSVNAQYFALSNMYESMLVVCLAIQAAFLVLDRWFNIRALGFPVALLLMGMMLYDLSLP